MQYQHQQDYYSGDDNLSFCDPAASFGCLVSYGKETYHRLTTRLADVPPETAHCDDNVISNSRVLWKRNDSILIRHWSPADGLVTSSSTVDKDDRRDTHSSASKSNHHLTYGEVTPLGVRQLAYEMGISKCVGNKEDMNSTKEDTKIIFYDLGSGVGRLVTQMYLDQPHRVAKAIGIELASDRHMIGAMALEGLLAAEDLFDHYSVFDNDDNYNYNYNCGDGDGDGDEDEDNCGATGTADGPSLIPVELINGNALAVDFDLGTTHVYISSLCFPEDVLLTIQTKLLGLPNIQVVAALNRLDLLIAHQWEERSVPIQMSWGDGIAKVYRKT